MIRCEHKECYNVRSERYMVKMPWGIRWCIPCVLWWFFDNKGKDLKEAEADSLS